MSSYAVVVNPIGWLRNARFDLTLIVGVALLALTAGALVVLQPHWFYVLLALDLWLLGYPHVIATFTRLSFDMDSFRENKFLVLGLPWIICAGTVAMGYFLGFWAVATTYLYWQWFHYTRQSYGIMRFYYRKSGPVAAADERLTTWALYLLPLWGILYRSFQRPPKFLGLEVKYFPTHEYLVYGVGAVVIAFQAYWLWRQFMAWRERRLPVALSLYMLSHFIIFFVGYIAIDNISFGWLVINVWHNAQYIFFVWRFNTNRFQGGVDERRLFLSTLSQPRPLNMILYFLVCLSVSTLVYASLVIVFQMEIFAAIPLATILVYQSINFHHYIVDGLIWKVRRKKVPVTQGAVA
jgi:hypothetical protein